MGRGNKYELQAITFLCVETNEFPMKEGIEIAVEEAFTVSRNAAIKVKLQRGWCNARVQSLMHICLHSLDDDVIEMAERKLAELKA